PEPQGIADVSADPVPGALRNPGAVRLSLGPRGGHLLAVLGECWGFPAEPDEGTRMLGGWRGMGSPVPRGAPLSPGRADQLSCPARHGALPTRRGADQG